MPMNLVQRNRAKAFWSWWETSQKRLAKVEDARDPIFDEAVALLKKYDDALGIEIAVPPKGSRRLIITAYGDADHQQSVLDLFEVKPALGAWQAVAFRPAEGADFELEIGGFSFSGEQIWFEPLRDSSDPSILGLEVHFTGSEDIPNEVAATAAGLAVMAVVGELSFMKDISAIRIGPSGATHVQELIPLARLPQFIEWSKKGPPRRAPDSA
jgi:hypothetical protein